MKYSTLWLSLLAAFSAQAAEADAKSANETPWYSGYSLQEAKEAKTNKWRCSDCEQPEGWVGDISVGVGYGDDDGASRARNWNPTQSDQGMAGIFNADLQRRTDDNGYTKLKAKDVGLERFGFGLETGSYDGVRLNVGYTETPYYWSNNGLTAYHGSDNVLSAGDLGSFDKEVKRKKVTAGIAYTPKSAWRPHASFSHEKKEGTLAYYTNTIPGVGGMPGLMPKPIESSETTLAKAGVAYQADKWMMDFSYNGSLYRNSEAALYYGSSANPYENEMALEPDNDFHQVALSGQYQLDGHYLNGRILRSRATSSGEFGAFANSPVTTSGFDGEINTFQADGRWVGRINRQLTLRANAEYRDREDDSDMDAVIGNEREDSSRHHTKAGMAADYRLTRGLKLTGGYDYLTQTRSTGEREEVEENTFYLKSSYRPASDWQLDAKASWSTRDGSDWRYDNGNSSPNLRPFYLADRDRLELKVDATYQITDDMETTAEVWWAKDEYREGDIGQSEGEDQGIDLGLNYHFSERTDGHVFVNQQRMDSNQNHANADAPTWNAYSTDITDKVTTVGLGLSHKTESDIELGLDYSYSYGKGETSTSYDYENNSSQQHRVEVYSIYPINKQHSLRWDLRYESFEGEDYLLTGEESTMGDLNDDYDAYFTSVSWQYKF